MSKSRRKFDEEFKKRIVRASYTSERSIKEVAESFGINESLLYRWRKAYTPEGDKTELSSQQEEIKRLLSRIAQLEEDNYILKKASAYFAKHQK